MLLWRYCKDMQTYFGYFGHAWLHSMIASPCTKDSKFICCMHKISFIIHFFLTALQRILQFDWPAAFWPICQDPKFWQICWWNINNNISFHFRLLPIKTSMTKFFKKSYLGVILDPFCPNFRKKWFFLEKRAQSVIQRKNYLPLRQKSENHNEPFLRKLLDGQTKNQFIPLISSWDTANFKVIRLIEKSCNLIGQEHFGPYLRNQNFPKYEICLCMQQLQ